MSRYVIKLDALDTIVAEDMDLESSFCDIVFAHKLDGKTKIEMVDLTFGFTLTKDGVVVKEFSYPPSGTRLLRSDQEYIHVERVEWIPFSHYTLYWWYKPAGQAKIEKTREFLSPQGKAPYASWKWNDLNKGHEPPKKMPGDGYVYAWEESTKSWKPETTYLSSLNIRRDD
jgi:hypothetical protein